MLNNEQLIIIGVISTVLSLTYRVPQIYKIYKTKSAKDLSLWMFCIQNLSYVGYIIYAIGLGDWIYFGASVLSLVQNFIILGFYYYLHCRPDQ